MTTKEKTHIDWIELSEEDRKHYRSVEVGRNEFQGEPRQMFPILGEHGQAVPFDIVLRHQAQAVKNHGQSVHRLAERGGLDWHELLAVLSDVRWRQVSTLSKSAARAAAIKIVEREELTNRD